MPIYQIVGVHIKSPSLPPFLQGMFLRALKHGKYPMAAAGYLITKR